MTPPHRTIVVPGSGVIVRWPGAVVVIGGEDDEVAAACLAHLTGEQQEPPAAGVLIERLRSLTSHDLAAAVVTPAGMRLLRLGTARAELLDDASPDTEPATADTSQEDDVDATATPIWLGIGDPPADATGPSRSGTSSFDLRAGVVPGRGVLLDARQPLAAVAPAPSPFEIVDLAASPAVAPDRIPLPQAGEPDEGAASELASDHRREEVLGIECSRKHFNNPIAAYCQVCGISMVHLTHHLVPGSRPTLGYIVFDNGATYALDRPYLIGREPTPSPESALAPLVADDLDHTVSREHAEVSFDGWNVVVADLGSTNGTFHWDTTAARWERIMPNHPVVIDPGVSVAVGRKTFVFETVARSV